MNDYMIYWRDGSVWQRYWSARPDQLQQYLHALREERGDDVVVLLMPYHPSVSPATSYGDDGMAAYLDHLKQLKKAS